MTKKKKASRKSKKKVAKLKATRKSSSKKPAVQAEQSTTLESAVQTTRTEVPAVEDPAFYKTVIGELAELGVALQRVGPMVVSGAYLIEAVVNDPSLVELNQTHYDSLRLFKGAGELIVAGRKAEAESGTEDTAFKYLKNHYIKGDDDSVSKEAEKELGKYKSVAKAIVKVKKALAEAKEAAEAEPEEPAKDETWETLRYDPLKALKDAGYKVAELLVADGLAENKQAAKPIVDAIKADPAQAIVYAVRGQGDLQKAMVEYSLKGGSETSYANQQLVGLFNEASKYVANVGLADKLMSLVDRVEGAAK